MDGPDRWGRSKLLGRQPEEEYQRSSGHIYVDFYEKSAPSKPAKQCVTMCHKGNCMTPGGR